MNNFLKYFGINTILFYIGASFVKGNLNFLQWTSLDRLFVLIGIILSTLILLEKQWELKESERFREEEQRLMDYCYNYKGEK